MSSQAGPACRACARCGRAVRTGGAHWPEGWICATCHTHALETYGTCAGCGADRLTPGIAPDGGRLCTDCADGLGDFTCEACGREARRHRRGVCGNCVLGERLAALLDDGTGSIRRELVPFAEAFCQMKRPRGGMTWIGRPHVREMLRTLADPGTPVTHETLNGMSPWRSVAYLRDLLMLHGVLPPADRNLMLFERWLGEALSAIGQSEHRRLVERFASWHVRRRLRGFAGRGTVTGKQIQQARDEIRLAIAFLAWLHGRGRALADCRQGDVDAWYAGGYTARRLTHAFLRWAMSSELLPRLEVPHQDTANPAPISQRQRLDLLQRMITDEKADLLTRVAAILMLLYAQPLTRILGLTIDDIRCDDGEVTIRLGDPPAPVPGPFAGLLIRYAGQRLNLTTATNAGARWLFPGRRGGQPMNPETIERRLRRAGIPALAGRTAALRHLVLQAPAPVIATMLGYKHQQAARVAAEAGSPWSRYAPEDHDQPPSAEGDS
jgi:integrase